MPSNTNIAVLILAAGASTRMGITKQLLKWGNSTIIGHAIEVAQELNIANYYVVLGANYQEINSEIEHYPIQILKNEDWKLGLGKSIAFGVKHIKKSNSNIDGILITLADQPLINAGYLNSLIASFNVGKHNIIATSYHNGKQGVPVLFDKFYFDDLSQLSDDNGAKSILLKYSENVSIINASDLILDIDTFEDYESLYNDHHHKKL